MNAIVDTTAWSLGYRRAARALSSKEQLCLQFLTELMSDGQAQMLGVVRQELLSGLREGPQFERLRHLLQAFSDVHLETEDYEEAARMSNVCRAKGITGSMVDYLICATAARRDWSIFTLDHDFEGYAKHLPIKLFRVK